MTHRIAGRSMIAFGVVNLIATIIFAFIVDACTVDLLILVAILLGLSVIDGSDRAIRWSIALMGLYTLVTICMVVFGLLGSDYLKVGGRPLRPAEVPWAVGYAGVMGVWALGILGLLIRARRARRMR